MYCRNCGTKNHDEFKLCTKCGEKLGTVKYIKSSKKEYAYLHKKWFWTIIASLFIITTLVFGNNISLPKGSSILPFAPDDPAQEKTALQSDGLLTVSYIDVGQGDSILIESPNGKTMLIDAGESSSQTVIADYLTKKGINRIDVLVATHPHADHIGAMAYIVEAFEIGSVYMPKAVTTTKTYENLLTTIKNKRLSIITAKAGAVINFDRALTVEIIAPVGSSYDDLNSYSAVIRLSYGENVFLFTGDAESDSEQEMLNSGSNIKADVLKVGHHGSDTSTSQEFLEAVSPQYAIISVGTGNRYGHPSQAILDRLTAAGVEVFRTDEHGTIVVTSDGKSIEIDKKASSYNPNAPPDSKHLQAPSENDDPQAPYENDDSQAPPENADPSEEALENTN